MKNLFAKISVITTLIILVSVVIYAQEVPDIKSSLDYLKTYKFGMNREPLEPILNAIKTTQNNPQKQEQLSKQLVSVLPETSIDGKRFIARQLLFIGTPSIVPDIAPLLKNSETIDIACRILEQIPGKEATQCLIEALKQTTSDDDKVFIINALSRRKDAQAIEVLVPYLDNSSEKVCNSTVLALASIGGKDAAKILWDWAKSKDTIEKLEVQSSILKIADKLSSDTNEKNTVLEIYTSLFADNRVTSVNKGYALRGLVQLKGKDMFDDVWNCVISEDKILSATAVDLLKDPSFSNDLVAEKCINTLKTANPRVQLGLLEVIDSRKITSAMPQVLDLAETAQPEVKISAIQCLVEIGDIKAMESLMNMALNAPKEIKEAAQDTLTKINIPDGNKYLMGKVKGENLELKKLAVQLLTERRATDAKELIASMIEKDDKDVLDDALTYFGVIGSEADLPLLFSKLMADESNAPTYITTISLILDRIGDESKKVNTITEQWKKCQNDAQKKAMIALLGNLKSPESFAVLKELLNSEPTLKTPILQAMARCEDINALNEIISAIEKEPAGDVKNAGILSSLDLLRNLQNITERQKYDYYVNLWQMAGDNPNLQKNILGGMSRLSLLDAFNFVESINVTDAIKADWANARFNLAKNLCFAYPSKTVSILEETLPNLKDKQAEEVKQLLNGLKNVGEFLTTWSISGPYKVENYDANRLFNEMSFPPETDINSVKDWRILPMKVRADGLIYADLFEFLNGELECVAYVACKITVPEPSAAKILLGTNDGVKVWLNGKLIHSFPDGRTMIPDEDQVSVNLEKSNILLMAVYNQGANWEFTAKLQGVNRDKVVIEPYSP